jgi:hypothetical protein
MAMQTGIIIAAVISGIAGKYIRIGAFTLFALVIATGFGAVSAANGHTAPVIGISTLVCLVTMETAYVIGTFCFGLWRRLRRNGQAASLTDTARNRSD